MPIQRTAQRQFVPGRKHAACTVSVEHVNPFFMGIGHKHGSNSHRQVLGNLLVDDAPAV